jgi:hypothetical protein
VPPSPFVAAAAESSERRTSNPALDVSPVEVPLLKLSRVHIAVHALARASGTDHGRPWARQVPAVVVLDTGASLAFATARVGAEVPLRTGTTSRPARSFSGARGALYPLEPGESLRIALVPDSDARAVHVPVDHIAPATLHNADVIAPPQAFAPSGGAVALDFRGERLRVCETIAACRPGTGWERLAARPCAKDPELVTVDAAVNGHSLPLHLDTGAPTLLFRRHFEAAQLGQATRSLAPGTLTGFGGAAPVAEIATGRWRFAVSDGGRVELDAATLWVVGERGDAGPTRCFPAGSIGTDLLQQCELVLADGTPTTGFIRCRAPR